MSPSFRYLLILLMTLSCPRMSTTRSSYVSEFEYAPRFHPSRNPECASRYVRAKRAAEDFEWDRPSIEIRAVLSRCSEENASEDFHVRRKRRYVEEQDPSTITNCTRKIVISMRFNNIGKTEVQEKFVVVEHVLDSLTMRKIPLRNPYVIKVRQEAVLQLYGLKFKSVVNAEAREEVINNRKPNFTGCDTGPEHPTCGRIFAHGQSVPFSEGFCCSCGSNINEGHRFGSSNRSSGAKSNYGEVTNKPCNRSQTGCDSVARSQKKSNAFDSHQTSKEPVNMKLEAKSEKGLKGVSQKVESTPTTEGSNQVSKDVNTKLQTDQRGSEGIKSSDAGLKMEARPPSLSHKAVVLSKEPCVNKKLETVGLKTNEDVGRTIGSCVEAQLAPHKINEVSSKGSYVHKKPETGNNKEIPGWWSSNPVGSEKYSTNKHDRPEVGKPPTVDKPASIGKTGERILKHGENSCLKTGCDDMNNLEFRLIGSKKSPRFKEKSSSSFVYEESCSGNPLRSTKCEARRKFVTDRRSKDVKTESERKKPESFHVDKSPNKAKRRNKVFPVAWIDSLAIRPSMHLNEPLKNLSTALLNSNGLQTRDGGNLNRVMGNTSRGTFNERRFQSNKDQASLSETVPARRDDFSYKKRSKETIRNYTPQKRTLKDLSFGNDRELRGKHVMYGETNNHRSRRHLRRRHSRRGSKKTREKRRNGDSGFLGINSNRDHNVQVYLNDARPFVPIVKPGKSERREEKKEKDENQLDRVDEQIEEKFSRISDALKEDTMGKTITEEKESKPINPVNEKEENPLKNEEVGTPSYEQMYEIPDVEDMEAENINKNGPSASINQNSYIGSQSEQMTSNQEDNLNNLDLLDDYKSSTSNSELVVLPTMGSVINDPNQVTANMFAPEGLDEIQSFDLNDEDASLFTTADSGLTRAVIVVDLFKIATHAPTTTTESSGFIGGLRKNIEKAFGLKPGNKTLIITEGTTAMVEETTINSTTETTKITDEMYRPSIKPFESERTLPGGAEFHNEVVIDETTFPDETDVPATVSTTELLGSNPRRMPKAIRRRKKKRMTPSAIKKRGLGDRGDYRASGKKRSADPAIKFSFEAGNVNMVKQSLGRDSSFSQDRRDYLHLRFRDPEDKTRKFVPENDRVRQNVDRRRGASVKLQHPWFVTTKTSEFTVRPTNNQRPIFSSKTSTNFRGKMRDEADSLEDTTGRILSPCTKTRRRINGHRPKSVICGAENRASRKLLSIQTGKRSTGHRSREDRDKIQDEDYVKDEDEDEDVGNMEEDEEDEEESEKCMKEQSKKREDESKLKKGNKHRDKKQSTQLSEDYDYFVPGGQMDVEDRPYEGSQADNNLESVENYELGTDLTEKDGNFGISDNQLIDNSIDKYSDDFKTENQVRSVDASKDGVQTDRSDEAGKDFDISLTGKIHLESDSYGRPVSVSINAAPEFPRKDSIDDGKVYGNRFPSEPGTFVDDPLGSGTDNANFLPSIFDDPSLSEADQRRIAREYYLDTIRARNRKNKYRNEINPRTRLLHLQKKSVDASEEQDLKQKNKDDKKNHKRAKKDSGSSFDSLYADFDSDIPKDNSGQDDTLNVGNPIIVISNEDDLKKDDEVSVELPQISLDLSNLPESDFLEPDVPDGNPSTRRCFAPNLTTRIVDSPTDTTITLKYLGSITQTTLISIQDMALVKDVSNVTKSVITEKTTSPTTITTETPTIPETIPLTTMPPTTTIPPTTILPTTTTTTTKSASNSSVSKAKVPYSQSPTSLVTKNLSKYSATENNTDSVERKNMLAVSEFVKKLEKLVSDAGNSSNATGRTLIHLKKFIIVPDNQTFWSLKEFSEPENVSGSAGSAETQVIVMGDKDTVPEADVENPEEEKDKAQRNLIREIISSVIRGDNSKRDLTPRLDDLLNDPTVNLKVVDSPRTKKESDENSNASNTEEQEKENEHILDKEKKCDNARTKSISNAKEKREVSNTSVNRKEETRDKKKDSKHSKKKRRRKRKRKFKKKENRKKKNNKKAKSKWPFKRNLLMLSEEEQIPLDYESKEENSVRKRENKQIRGGQDCTDKRHPPNVDLSRYLESAHCLRFSDLWYSVYQLEEPVRVHQLHLQVYMKRTSPDGSVSWKDLTNGSSIRLGTFDRYYRNREKTITFAYSDDVSSISNVEYNLDPAVDRLLVPSTITGKRSKYSEGWSSEYLVVRADKINEDQDECDKAGVGFTAFAAQPDRCRRISGSCLKNQPLKYWRHDIEARESGRAGCYFLSNFARVPGEAIRYNVNGTEGSREFLALEYHSPHVSVIDVELGDDYNALLRAGSPGQLTEVHADNTPIDYTLITLLITNKGSSPGSYRARITDCPQGAPTSWPNAETATKTIPPHRDRKVTLELYGRLSLNEFSCSVVLLNRFDEPVATREVKAQKMDRCFCVRHCTCKCVGDERHDEGCKPMLQKHYRAAGFRGPVPTTPANDTSIWPIVVTTVCLVVTVLLLLLLLLGFFKWIFGLYFPCIGRWGLDDLLDAGKMSNYYEKRLKSRSVVFNELGQPVHPDTGKKTVRICNRTLEFFLNLTFFYIYPITVLCIHPICCVACAKHEPNNEPSTQSSTNESKASLTSEKEKGPTMISLSTYGDSVNSKLEEEDMKYVMEELKKSQESLQNLNKYKRKQSLEEPSSTD